MPAMAARAFGGTESGCSNEAEIAPERGQTRKYQPLSRLPKSRAAKDACSRLKRS